MGTLAGRGCCRPACPKQGLSPAIPFAKPDLYQKMCVYYAASLHSVSIHWAGKAKDSAYRRAGDALLWSTELVFMLVKHFPPPTLYSCALSGMPASSNASRPLSSRQHDDHRAPLFRRHLLLLDLVPCQLERKNPKGTLGLHGCL